jgi:gamma-glutamyl:cysteine ligase YbdK (ATP-grasp superfamily)
MAASARLCRNSEQNEVPSTTTSENALQAIQLGSEGVLRRPKTGRHRVFCTPSTDNRHLTRPAETPILRFA